MLRLLAWTMTALVCLGTPAAAEPAPAFTFESLLQTYFDDESGLISFDQYDIAFAPEAPLNAAVAVTDAKGTVIKSFPFFPDYRWREGVFARAQVQGPAAVTLTEPGVYNIIFLIDGKPTSRLAVALEQTDAGADPFDPTKKFRFFGLWQVYGHLTMESWKDQIHPRLSFWVGGKDLAEDAKKDMFFVTLKRDGKVIGHSRRTQGFMGLGHYKRVDIDIYRPHEEKKAANAELLMVDEWTRDGDYELIVTRTSDDAVIRRFQFKAKGGAIQPLANTDLKFEPHIDYIVPRVIERGNSTYAFEEAIWIQSPAKP